MPQLQYLEPYELLYEEALLYVLLTVLELQLHLYQAEKSVTILNSTAPCSSAVHPLLQINGLQQMDVPTASPNFFTR